MATLDLGDTTTLQFRTVNQSSTATNATTVVLRITQPDGTILTPSITNPPAQTGYYLYDFVSTQAGRHQIYWLATGTVNQAHNDVFDVRPANSGMIFGLADARESLRIIDGAVTNDNKLRDYISAVTSVIESLYGSAIQRTVTEQKTGGSSVLSLSFQPVVSITTVKEYMAAAVNTLTQAATPDVSTFYGFTFDPQKGSITRRNSGGYPIPFLDEVWITYVTGLAIIPENVILAARELLRFWWQFGQEGRSATRNPASEGTVSVMGYAVPNHVVQMLGNTPQAPGFA